MKARAVRPVASAAVKADVAEQFKAKKIVTERTADGRSCRSDTDQTCRSRKVDENANSYDDHCEARDGAGCHRESNGDQGDEGEVCVECGRDCSEAWDSA